MLLTFDESEVRRIVAVCNSVLDYLGVADVVEHMADLATFIKNLTPGLTGMSKLIDQRQKELTNPVHAAKLVEHSDYVSTSQKTKVPNALKTARPAGCRELSDTRERFFVVQPKVSCQKDDVLLA